MEPGTILFQRKTTILNPHKELDYVIIYSNGINAYFHLTNGKQYISRGEGNIEFVPKDDIICIYEYKFIILKEPKIPTGFHLETKDDKICIIGLDKFDTCLFKDLLLERIVLHKLLCGTEPIQEYNQ